MPNVTQAEFAALMGLSRPYVAKLATKGIIPLAEDGTLDPDAAIQAMHAAGESTTGAGTMSFSEFARHLGCKPSYVTELRHKGRLVLTPDGKRVLVEDSKKLIDETADPSKQAVAARHATTRAGTPEGETGEGEDATETSPEYQLWRARRERAAALREELKLGEEAKDYLKRADVEAAIADLVAAFRNAIETLDDRLAPLLASEPDTHKIRAILTEERNHTLNNLAAGFATLTKK